MSVTLEPPADPGAVPSVVRLHLAFAVSQTTLPELSLYVGALSDYHSARVRDRDIPATLAERSVPIRAWLSGPKTVAAAPDVRLAAGETYSLAAAGIGSISAFRVADSDDAPYFDRIWPPRDVTGGVPSAVYCSELEHSVADQSARLGPDDAAAQVTLGIGPTRVAANRCFTLSASGADSEVLLPPVALSGALVDPTPLRRSAEPEPAALECSAEEVLFGLGCAVALDDRLVVRSPESSALWSGRAGVKREFLLVSRPNERFVVRGLEPSRDNTIELSVSKLDGSTISSTERVTAQAPRAHVVINEVLANAIGPEPAQEWVELFNDGMIPIDLSDLEFSDGGLTSPLPSGLLVPGGFALLVPEAFTEGSPGDVPPASGCILLRLPKLGKNGLSNSGEPLSLERVSSGELLSTFPALAAPKAGSSVARREPAAADTDTRSFAVHAAPGASPCALNTVEPELK